jgi:hypothetical protein
MKVLLLIVTVRFCTYICHVREREKERVKRGERGRRSNGDRDEREHRPGEMDKKRRTNRKIR